MTALTEKQGQATRDDSARLRGRLRAMTITVIVLAVALIGLGAWVIYDLVAESDTAVSGEIETLLDDYTTAWNDYDSEAFLALVTDDYTFEFADEVTGAEAQAMAISQGEFYDGQVEKVGDPIMFGDGPFYVAQANHTSSTTVDMDGISMFTIVEEGDTFLIQSHVFIGGME